MFFPITRRTALKSAACGFGYLAFADLATRAAEKEAAKGPLAPKPSHSAAKAKHVIFLCMEGAPSHVDTFDYKPKLTADDGKAAPRGKGGPGGRLLGSPFKFAQHGQAGLRISDLFPELARQADKLCLLCGMQTDLPTHAQAFLQMHCGLFQAPRPSLGAWVLYGLGSTNANLPGFITISPPQTNGGSANYAASFLPAVYQGTRIGRGTGGGGGKGGKPREPPPPPGAPRGAPRLLPGMKPSTPHNPRREPPNQGVISS